MRQQQHIWQLEHQQKLSLPSIQESQPSGSVIFFIEYLKKNKVATTNQQVIDIGCGSGSNSVYMAELNNSVVAIDYIPEAIANTKLLAKEKKVVEKIAFYTQEIDRKWPFEENAFDLALDCFSSIDIETREGRDVYKKELLRTLKPGGYALITVVSTADEIESELLKTSPGFEHNSTIWPGSGKLQKDYDEKELREFYKEFMIKEVKAVTKLKHKLGIDYLATNLWMIIQKP